MDITSKIENYLNEAVTPKNKQITDVIKKISVAAEKYLRSEFSSNGTDSPNELAGWGEFKTSDEAWNVEKKLKAYLESFELKTLGISYILKHYQDDDVWVTMLKVKFPIKPIGSKKPRHSYYD